MTGADRPRVLFHVQHLLGIGHLKRATTLARAFEDAGLAVTLVSGGPPVPGLNARPARLVQLAPMRAEDHLFKALVDEHDQPIDDRFKTARCARLLALFEETEPDIVVTELFPFGRRQLGFELLPLMEAAAARRKRPAIVCSVRDVLAGPPKPERIEETVDRVRRYYDLVLVHGDPSLVGFDRTFPLAARIDDRIRYTGYVVDRSPPRDETGRGEVIVSAGGGAVSETLLRAAMTARAATRLRESRWRVLAGHALPEGAFRSLAAAAPDGVVVERARPDFTTLLSNCVLSISQGGYNTVMEVIAAGARGVIVPYAGGQETEQTLRAALIGRRAGLQVMAETGLDAAAIAAAVERAMDRPPAGAGGLDLSGAPVSATILLELAESRRAGVR